MVIKKLLLFFKFLADTCPFLGPLVRLFWISGDVSSGFQSQSGLPYSPPHGSKCNVHSPRSTSGATHADLLIKTPHCVVNFFFFFFFKFLADTCPFLGPLVPLFWISGDVSSGFQSQSGFCLIRYFCRGECNVHSSRFTSGATLANLLAAGAQPVTSPHACAEVGLGSDSNVQLHEQKTNALPLCQRPGILCCQLSYPDIFNKSFSYTASNLNASLPAI